jgi:hypothetical protein
MCLFLAWKITLLLLLLSMALTLSKHGVPSRKIFAGGVQTLHGLFLVILILCSPRKISTMVLMLLAMKSLTLESVALIWALLI